MSITSSLLRPAVIAAGSLLIFVPIASANAARAANQDDGAVQKYEVRKDHAGRTVYCASSAPSTGSHIPSTRCETAEDL
jgi:predicted PhzF superfamily epimerase YddE/YHI9